MDDKLLQRTIFIVLLSLVFLLADILIELTHAHIKIQLHKAYIDRIIYNSDKRKR